jgi:crossover junction endodeoxyribonuclease RuvC
MTLLGIDPGLASTGYGVVRFDGNRFIHVAHGVIRTPAGDPLPERLRVIHDHVRALAKEHRPDGAAVEELYFARNVVSAIPVAQSRGALLVALAEEGVPVGFYTPQQVKQAVVGRGRGEKGQVARMVCVLLRLDALGTESHDSDALALAICHANRWNLPAILERVGTG